MLDVARSYSTPRLVGLANLISPSASRLDQESCWPALGSMVYLSFTIPQDRDRKTNPAACVSVTGPYLGDPTGTVNGRSGWAACSITGPASVETVETCHSAFRQIGPARSR